MGVRYDDRRARVALRGTRHRARRRCARYFDRLVEFALAAEWGRRQIPRASVAVREVPIRRIVVSGAPAPRGRGSPRLGQGSPARAGHRRMTSQRRCRRSMRRFSQSRHRPRTCTSAGSRCSRLPRDGRVPGFLRAARSHRAAAGARAALPPEARARAARPAHAGVDRRPGLLRGSPRVPGARTTRRARRRGDVDTVAPRPPAVGDVDL